MVVARISNRGLGAARCLWTVSPTFYYTTMATLALVALGGPVLGRLLCHGSLAAWLQPPLMGMPSCRAVVGGTVRCAALAAATLFNWAYLASWLAGVAIPGQRQRAMSDSVLRSGLISITIVLVFLPLELGVVGFLAARL